MSTWAARTLRRVAHEQRCFSLIELITVSALLIVVLTATLMLLERTIEIAPQDVERSQSIQDAQVGLHRMVRDLREAYAFNPAAPPSSTQMDVLVPVAGGVDKRIVYDCAQAGSKPDTSSCLRYEGDADFAAALGNGQRVVDRVVNDVAVTPIFNQVTDSYIEAKVEVPSSGERENGFPQKIVLDDGFFLRNCQDDDGC